MTDRRALLAGTAVVGIPAAPERPKGLVRVYDKHGALIIKGPFDVDGTITLPAGVPTGDWVRVEYSVPAEDYVNRAARRRPRAPKVVIA